MHILNKKKYGVYSFNILQLYNIMLVYDYVVYKSLIYNFKKSIKLIK